MILYKHPQFIDNSLIKPETHIKLLAVKLSDVNTF